MKKAISILLVLVVCLSMTLTVFATTGENEFVISPGEGGKPCEHKHTIIMHQKNPSCIEDGHTGKEVCEDCGETVNPGKVIPSKGHTFKDQVCTICGAPYQPTTSDFSMILWVVLMVLAAAALVTVTVIYRKKA